MNKRILAISLIVLAILLVGGIYFWNAGENPNAGNNNNSDIRTAGDAVAATPQRPRSNVTVAVVYLTKPGYVVIYDQGEESQHIGDGFGKVIGKSALLAQGQHNKVVVNLSRSTNDGEVLYALIHYESDNNQSFDPEKDKVSDRPAFSEFQISSTAKENFDVTI